MKLADFNGYEQNQRMYGETAGRKMGIFYRGKDYISEVPRESNGTRNEKYTAKLFQ